MRYNRSPKPTPQECYIMSIVNPAPEGRLSQSQISSAPAKPADEQVKGERPMFDTLQVTKELRKSGFAEPQAEAIVVAFGAIAGDVATKDDLIALEKKMVTKDDLKNFVTKDDLKNFATKDDLKYFVTEASMLKALGEFSERMHRSFLQVAMGTVTVNIAMVTAVFVIAKYLL